MWWTQERPGAEHLVSRLLPMMLVRSVDVDAKEADVKRMFGCVSINQYVCTTHITHTTGALFSFRSVSVHFGPCRFVSVRFGSCRFVFSDK